jgi:hypothetical protein
MRRKPGIKHNSPAYNLLRSMGPKQISAIAMRAEVERTEAEKASTRSHLSVGPWRSTTTGGQACTPSVSSLTSNRRSFHPQFHRSCPDNKH